MTLLTDTDENTSSEQALVQKWLVVIKQYERKTEKWERRAKKIIKRYKDERGPTDSKRRYNVLWSNVETLKPFLFAQIPNAEVDRRFKDDDPVGRVAADVLQRALDFTLHTQPFGATMRQAVLDYLLPGRGVVWIRYVPHLQDLPGSEVADDGVQLTDDSDEEEIAQEVVYEEVVPDYVHWADFGHADGRTWEEVPAVWRRVYLSREEGKRRFGDAFANIPLDYIPEEYRNLEDVKDDLKKAVIYEIWDASTKQVIWISKEKNEPLEVLDDPLGLDKFFPCSRPLYATVANDSLIPIPDYLQYQDQATELDELTGRIAALTKSIKVAGVYDASVKALDRLLSEGVDNKLIAVESWAMFAEKGGLKGAVDFLPLEEVVKALLELYNARERVKGDLYEVTGMSDIIRGNTAPEETATAQNIKSHFATMRLDERQREVQRFARNAVHIMGEIIAAHFGQDTLAKITGIKLLTAQEKQEIQQVQQLISIKPEMQQMLQQFLDPKKLDLMDEPTWDDVMALLRNNAAREFRIDIETDSTVQSDQQADQQSAIQFLETFGQFLEQGMQAAQQQPVLAPMIAEAIKYLVRRFPAARSLESRIDETLDKLVAMSKQPQPQQPDPKVMQAQQQGQLQQQKQQQDMQLEQQRMQLEQQSEERQRQADLQLETLRQQAETARQQAAQQHEAAMAQMQASIDAKVELLREQMQQQTDLLMARLNNIAKIEVAEVTAGASLQAAQIAAASQSQE